MTSPADTLTVQQFDHLTELLYESTAGPWEHVVDHHQRGEVEHSIYSESADGYVVENLVSKYAAQDGALIAAMHAALPALLATVRRQQAALDAAHRLCADYEGGRADLDAWDVVEQVRALASPAPTEATT